MKYWFYIILLLPNLASATQEHCEVIEKKQIAKCYHPLENKISNSEKKVLFHKIQIFLAQKLSNIVLPAPDEIQSLEEMEKYTQKRNDINSTLEKLDSFASSHQKFQDDRWSYMSAVPDALVFILGGEFSFSFGIGGAAGALVGVVVLPVWVEKLDLTTGKSLGGKVSARISPIFWGNLEGGFGGGAKGGVSGGLGLIWNLSSQQLVDPKSIVGFGVGGAGEAGLGLGVGLRGGFLENLYLPGLVDFGYVVGSVSANFGAEAHINLNIPLVISTESIAKRLQSNPSYRLSPETIQSDIESILR